MVTLHDTSSVGGQAVVRGSVFMTDEARIDGDALVLGSAQVHFFAHVSRGQLVGSTVS
jgi:hypothetical protein